MSQHTMASDLADEIRTQCLGTRVARLHRVVFRAYEQALQPLGVTLPQLEILTALIGTRGSVRPAALAASLMLERSSLSRSLSLMQRRGWVTAAETSDTGRMMAVAISAQGTALLVDAGDAWRRAHESLTTSIGTDAGQVLDTWLEAFA